jgi:putative ABC transport system permease protein
MRRLLLRSWLWKPKVEDEVSGEVAFHLDMRVREYIAAGMTPEEARRTALARFGDLDRTRTQCEQLGYQRDRTMRRHQYLSELRQDLTFAIRQLLKNPGFTIVATLTLALGIGATAAIFSVVHAVVLRPLAVPEPERLVVVSESWRGIFPAGVSFGSFYAWHERNTSFAGLAAMPFASFNLADRDGAARIVGARVTGDFFPIFAVAPMLGRVFGADEDRPGHEQVVVLSEQLWTRRFAADPGIIGRDIRLSGRPYRVLGVMPAAFRLAADSEQLWVPAAFTDLERSDFSGHTLPVIARLKPGVTREQAQAEIVQLAAQLRKEQPQGLAERSAGLIDFTADFVGSYRERLWLLLGAVGLVLLIACGNVANLLLARGAVRVRELAVRSAMGAGRGRIVRQLLTESLLLAALGAAGGLALATVAISAFVRLSPDGVPRLEQARLDPLTIIVTMAIAASSSMLFGLIPAMRAARAQAHDVLRSGRSGAMGVAHDRARQMLIIAEVALTLVLLVGSGLLIRTALALRHVDLGFDPSGVLSARVSLPREEYAEANRARLAFERMADDVSHIPGVVSAAIVSQAPLGSRGISNGLVPEGRPHLTESVIDSVLRLITPDYLRTMRIPLKRGRAFTAADRAGAQRVMIVNETFAQQAWPNQDPIGKRVDCCEAAPDGKSPVWKVIVGVVGDVHARGPAATPVPEFYLPLAQAPPNAWDWTQRTLFLVARTTQDPAALTAPVRQAIARIDPMLPMFDINTMDERLADSVATDRFNTGLLTTLGVVGLMLAAIGIYGVIAYFVTQRTQEIGVRLALGASPGNVISLVVRQALRPVVTGVIVGIGLALLATRLIAAQLFGVAPRDPLTMGGVAIVLVAAAVVASVVPARRAARIDPTRALNQ